MNEKGFRLVWIFLVYDILIIVASFLGSFYLKYNSLEANSYYIILPLIIIIWVLVVLTFTSQNYYFREGIVQRIKNQIIDFIIFGGIVSSLVLILELKLYSRLILFGTIVMFFILRNAGFLLLYKYLSYMRAKGRHVKRLLVIGAGRIGEELFNYVKRDVSIGYSIVGFLDDNPDTANVPRNLIIGSTDDLSRILIDHRIEEVILAIPLTATSKIADAIETAEFHGLRIGMVPDYYRVVERSFETHTLGNLPIVSIRDIALDKIANQALKRSFDVVFSLAVLILLSPLFLIIALLVKLGSAGPVFYKPIRVGLGGKEFKCWKFRSMSVDKDPDHAMKSTVDGDPRITPIGSFLRKNSLDELPQFLNVLVGDMSVVGPRPHRSFLNEDMQKKVEGYMIRHYIKPGITGWAQVNGWRGPTETFEQKDQRTKHDLWYIDNWTFWLDIRIVLMTASGKSNKNVF